MSDNPAHVVAAIIDVPPGHPDVVAMAAWCDQVVDPILERFRVLGAALIRSLKESEALNEDDRGDPGRAREMRVAVEADALGAEDCWGDEILELVREYRELLALSAKREKAPEA